MVQLPLPLFLLFLPGPPLCTAWESLELKAYYLSWPMFSVPHFWQTDRHSLPHRPKVSISPQTYILMPNPQNDGRVSGLL